MKHSISLLGFALIAFVSCKKTDDTPATKNNTWTFGATTYTVNNYAKSSETLQAYDKAGNGVFFSFANYPTADGVYNVVSNSANLGANDVNITAFYPTSGSSYFASGMDGTKATIKLVSGSTLRLRISLPPTWMVKSGTDSLKLSAELGDL